MFNKSSLVDTLKEISSDNTCLSIKQLTHIPLHTPSSQIPCHTSPSTHPLLSISFHISPYAHPLVLAHPLIHIPLRTSAFHGSPYAHPLVAHPLTHIPLLHIPLRTSPCCTSPYAHPLMHIPLLHELSPSQQHWLPSDKFSEK